jgi:prevent-host-death family protein
MRKTSLAEAKSHLSALVDAAEHQHQEIIILRHGKAAAAIVPASVVLRKKSRKSYFTRPEVDGLLGAFGAVAPNISAVEELLASRR